MSNLDESIEHYDKINSKVTRKPVSGFRTNDKGNIIANSIQNIEAILNQDPILSGKIAFNEFTYEIELLDDIPSLMLEKGTIDDDCPPAFLGYIERTYNVLFKDTLLRSALTNVARRNVFNPVLDYLEECEKNWDGKIRSPDLLPVFLGTEKSPVTELQTKIFFVGAVAKAYEPDMKFDYVLDLIGGQGAGKTTFLKKMSNGWYTDQFTDFETKDNYGNMLRALIINDDEMTATNHSSFEILKKFISTEILEYRKPYGHMTVRRYKNFVMARTTNELTYLKDKTGERRFLPNMVNKSKQVMSPLTDLTQEIIDQLWGEFVHIYREGFSFLLTDEQERMLEEHRKSFMYIDAEEEEIENVLQLWNGNFITSSDIAMQMGESSLVGNRKLAKKIKYVMDNRKDWTAGTKRFGKTMKRGYYKN